MDPVRELPYWPAAMALLIEAGQMTASDYVQNTPIYCLHPKGRPQMSFVWIIGNANKRSNYMPLGAEGHLLHAGVAHLGPGRIPVSFPRLAYRLSLR